MNAAISHFTGIELLHLALYDWQVEEDFRLEYNTAERRRAKARAQKPNTKRCIQWRERNPEAYRAYQRKYRKEHREELNAKQREYRKKKIAQRGSNRS